MLSEALMKEKAIARDLMKRRHLHALEQELKKVDERTEALQQAVREQLPEIILPYVQWDQIFHTIGDSVEIGIEVPDHWGIIVKFCLVSGRWVWTPHGQPTSDHTSESMYMVIRNYGDEYREVTYYTWDLGSALVYADKNEYLATYVDLMVQNQEVS